MTTAISLGRRLEHGVDELVLAGEPVQDGLLAHADDGGDLVERDGVDAPRAEPVERRVEDAVTRASRRSPRALSTTR